ncbi:S-adenosyl-L-methionine-dependent methyltransferase [Histomonas meleagridis]|uniref:S-adenosyl-L-methionine-dependent methyltransferase n=1 Tax=Histomonas meleagridis TaxID=135588 RepID=UPI00355A8CFE|nr:S-adenosyl-L-methionine-dependent methyltransferase [Histomonas meleagridis]KAH0804662.1 S-adenosyl-L-methionine-dependent methyltransferase [Histomonas meleagridis]
MNPDTLQSCDYYYDTYAHFGAHESLLKDTARIDAFRNAIFLNRSLIEGKAVLDAGCGTGLFAMWAAKRGARVVYAVDRSPFIEYTKKIVELNGLSDKVKVIHGLLEEVELPEKVDLIICDFFGCGLLFDSMFPSFIVARDRFLKEGGSVFPSSSRIVMTAIEDGEYRNTKINFWDNVYGYKFTAMKKEALLEPLIDTCPTDGILCGECVVKEFDSLTVKLEDLSFTAPFTLLPSESNTAHAFVIWFDCFFRGPECSFVFSTSPYFKSTDYQQVVCYLNKPVRVVPGDLIDGELSMRQNEQNPRNEDIQISFIHNGKKYTQSYQLKV